MSNKVKYNSTGSEPDSLFKGNWAINITNPNFGGGPSSSTGLYNGSTVPTGGYAIYYNNTVFTAYSDNELLDYIGTIGGNRSSVEDALTWASIQDTILILDDQFKTIVTDDLVLNLDPTNTASYDRGESLVDISNSEGSSTFYNSPTYEAGSFGAIYLDATNQYIDFEAPGITSDVITVEMWANVGDYKNNMLFGFSRYDVYCYNQAIGFNTAQGDCYGITVEQATEIGVVNHWHHYVFEMHTGVNATTIANNKIWINGVEQSLSQINGSPSSTQSNFNGGSGRIGGWRASVGYFMEMYLGTFRIYNRALTQDEVTQNYEAQRAKYDHMNGYNIVQDGLTVNLDSSYEASLKKIISQGRWYDLSLYNRNVSLTNLVADPIVTDTVPAVSFDGTNDLAAINKHSTTTNKSTTVEVFMRFDDPNIIEPTTAQMNYILSDPQSGSADGHEQNIVTNSDGSIPLITYKSRCQYDAPTGLYSFYGYMQILGNGMNNYPTIFKKYYNSAGEEQTELLELNYPEIIDGNFFHYVWSVQNSDLGSRVLKHYLNGIEISGVYGNHTQDWNLFNTSSTVRAFNRAYSSVAVIRIYDRPLSAADALQNYKSCKSNLLYHYTKRKNITPTNLVFCIDPSDNQSYPGGTGTQIYDLTENNLDCQLENGIVHNDINDGILTFDGVDDQILIDGSGVLNFGKDDTFTLETWVKPIQNPSYGNTAGILGKRNAVGIDYYFPGDGNNRFRAGFRNATNGQNSFNSNTVITPGDWYHVVFTYTPGDVEGMKLYIDGVLDATSSNVDIAEFANDALNFEIGTNAVLGGTSTRMSTSFGATRIYNRDLSALEVYVNYNAFKDRLNKEIGGYAFKIDAADLNSYPGSGTTVTSIGSETFTSTLYGGAVYSSEGGGSFLFDGTDDIAISDISDFNIANMSFSVDCWFKFASEPESGVDDTHGFIGGGGWGGTGDAFKLGGKKYSNGYTEVGISVFGDGAEEQVPNDYNELEWNHYCGTIDISTGKAAIYLNGVQLSLEDSTYMTRDAMPLEWGAVIYSANTSNGIREYYQHGYIGPTRIWKNKALSEEEVLHQYNSEKDRFSEDVVFSYKINGNSAGIGANTGLDTDGEYDFVIDWGDGTVSNTITSSSQVNTDGRHTYSTSGEYTIQFIGVCKGKKNLYNPSAITEIISYGEVENYQFGFSGLNNMTSSASDVPILWDDNGVGADMINFYNNCRLFDQDLSSLDTSAVTRMRSAFYNARVFNNGGSNGINNWDVSNVTDMNSMFNTAYRFNQPIGNWDVSNVTNMYRMFQYANDFNQNIGGWDVSNVTNMYQMFNRAYSFNQDIGGWDVSNVTSMNGMFENATSFNQNLNSWNVSSVTNMSNMFQGVQVFDGNITSWDVSSATTLYRMFWNCRAFNQDISGWNVSNVTNMSGMFRDAKVFDQNLGSWNIGNVTNMSGMLDGATLSTANYDATLIGWAGQTPPSNITFSGGNSQYTLGGAGEAARNTLINTYGWTITDGGGV